MSKHRHRKEELDLQKHQEGTFVKFIPHRLGRVYKSSATIAFFISLTVVLIERFYGTGVSDTLIEKGNVLSPYTVIPFIGLLLSIAIIPLINEHWWVKRFYRVAVVIGVPMAVLLFMENSEWVYHSFLEYLSFITLLLSLYVISGGITIATSLKHSPYVNLTFLAIGGVIASLIGTTGAAMLLVRPLIKINAGRKHNAHVIIFFIFIVANIGGALTPLGDPPLFLGFLQGVDFFWTLKLLAPWATSVTILLAIFFIIDSYLYHRDKNYYHDPKTELAFLVKHTDLPVEVHGKWNLLFLAGVIGTILMYPRLPEEMSETLKILIQVGFLALFSVLSLIFTKRGYRKYNEFSWGPMKEVAILFAAIFVAMVPAVLILQEKGAHLGVVTPAQFFWSTGILSSFLDNTPTYLTFLSVGKAVSENALLLNTHIPAVILKDSDKILEIILKAISLGAVFMGAITYIGNGPNFMVKGIAERSNYKMPSFFGYMIWSTLILIPVFLVVTYIFL